MNIEDVGKKIAELRKQAGYSQKTLAVVLHITDKAISKWERGICLPDTALLPKLSVLLDSDIEEFIADELNYEKWVGLIDIFDCDFSQTVYDKPLIYYILSHYMLVGITDIYVVCNEKNKEFLSSEIFSHYGITFHYEQPNSQCVMIMNHPWFLFGSNLTQQFYGAMSACRNTKLVPDYGSEVVLFDYKNEYCKDRKKFVKCATKRTIGRGMICLDMSNPDTILEVASFIRMYQKYTGLMIGSLEEISNKVGLLNTKGCFEI